MKRKYIYLDTEYNNTNEEKLNVVCLSFLCDGEYKTFWTNKTSDFKEVIDYIESKKDHIFVAFAVEAESSALLSIGIDPLKLTWIDLYLEYKMLLNHNHRLQYGKQLLKGKEVTTYPPKFGWNEVSDGNNSKPSSSLSSACYKLLEVKIDTDRKETMRDILISGNGVEEHKAEIIEYCEDDVKYLPKLLKAICQEFKDSPYKTTFEEITNRAEYSVRTAKMVRLGYPVDVKAVENFSNSVQDILWLVQNEINELFPDIIPFKKKADRTFSWNQKATIDWVKSQKFDGWLKTSGHNYSLSLEAFTKFFDYRHNFPKDCFGAQIVRYLKLKQGLNGFSPKSKNKFVDYLGSDGRVRPYFNIFGSQSSRSQPKATGFLFLKSAWMRSLCSPSKGKVIGSIDYKSEEFLLAGVMSGDKVMVDAYMSGDPYLFFAKQAGAVPPSGTKETHKKARDLFKATTLGLSYDMSKIGLAKKLTKDMKRVVSEEEAQELIDRFYKLYSKYGAWKKETTERYSSYNHLVLPDGWVMYGDNRNSRSVGNFPVQGFGAVIMRKAVALAQDSGLDIILTLHDALYCEFDTDTYQEGMEILADCMQKAFKFYLKGDDRNLDIGFDANVWGKDLSDGHYFSKKLNKVKLQSIYIDDRSLEEYNQFKKYFEAEEFNL